MMFDGRGFAHRKEEELKERFEVMAKALRRKPKLVALVEVGNAAGRKYCQLKARVAARVGVEFLTVELDFSGGDTLSGLKAKLEEMNEDEGVDGVMIQMPFSEGEEAIPVIEMAKDVDGLREGSPFVPAVARAVGVILREGVGVADLGTRILVVGAKGEVGRAVMRELKKEYQEVRGMDKKDYTVKRLKEAEVVVSATGKTGLIGPEMVRAGVVAVDVGYPRGDFDPEVAGKARFFTPVPGGVGPVTVVMLLANLAEAVEKKN